MNILRIFNERYRLIDLSEKVEPGKVLGPRNDKRRYEIRPFAFPPGETMHEIDMESHISTHVEAPSHFMMARFGKRAKDVSELPLNSFIGVAILIDLSQSKPHQVFVPEDMKNKGVRQRDIVLIGNSPYKASDRPWFAAETAKWLAELPIKMIGFDRTVMIEPPQEPKTLEKYCMHEYMLSNDIPIIEVLTNLDKLRKKRFFFAGIPAKMGGLDSFPIRAIAFEPID